MHGLIFWRGIDVFVVTPMFETLLGRTGCGMASVSLIGIRHASACTNVAKLYQTCTTFVPTCIENVFIYTHI